MTNSMWQQTEEMAKKHDQGGSLWLKLAGDGDKAVVVFLGEPHPREVAFVDGKYVEVDEKMKAAGTKASLRVALNVALYDSKEVKVLEQGVMFFKDLVRVREKYGLEKWAFEIQRHGAAKDPKTTYSILPEHQLSAEQQKAFQALPQHDLAKLYSGEADGGGAKGGTVYGATDEYGYKAVENVCEIHDLHATMLHLLGMDHTRITFRFSGRDMRLTDVKGHVLKDICA